MNGFTKAEQRILRKLADLAYERELANALESLYGKFGKWKENKMTPFSLSDEIHAFHNGISRDLWALYDNRNNHIVVARAVACGIITREEVDRTVLQKIDHYIESYSKE